MKKRLSISDIQRRLKPWMFPIAMVLGVLFHSYISAVEWVVPYLIFTMLTITFCRVRPKEFDLSPMLWIMLAVQILGSVAVFMAVKPFGLDLAQAAFICVLCPTATAAPVVTGMLGGSIPRVAAFSVLSNLSVAVLAPVLFTWIGGNGSELSFTDEFMSIAMKVAPMIVFPMLLAFALYFCAPKIHRGIARVQGVSFYLWSLSLIVVVGRAVSFVMAEPVAAIPEMIAMALIAGFLCAIQFIIGRKVGSRYGDPVSGAQGLGQKNTILAIWMSLTYLNPVSSVGPAAYIAWQNTVNSLQMYFKTKRDLKSD
ncbi:MAG: transporter [Muribaculaceae bacterium]|nr:transporter [Muribaculaceae bacterium]